MDINPLTDVSLANQRNAKQNHSDTSPHTWRKGNPSTLLVGMQTGATTVENSMELLQKVRNGTAYDPVIPLLGL